MRRVNRIYRYQCLYTECPVHEIPFQCQCALALFNQGARAADLRRPYITFAANRNDRHYFGCIWIRNRVFCSQLVDKGVQFISIPVYQPTIPPVLTAFPMSPRTPPASAFWIETILPAIKPNTAAIMIAFFPSNIIHLPSYFCVSVFLLHYLLKYWMVSATIASINFSLLRKPFGSLNPKYHLPG